MSQAYARLLTNSSYIELGAEEQQAQTPDHSVTSNSPTRHGPPACRAEPDFYYLQVLNDNVKDVSEPQGHCSRSTTLGNRKGAIPAQQSSAATYPHLTDIDNDYLVKKGIYDLPHSQQVYIENVLLVLYDHLLILHNHRDALIKAYFEHVHSYYPVIDRADFVQQYQSGHCSRFLLYAMLTAAAVYTPIKVLSACSFSSRSEAQDSFLTRARLCHDFETEHDLLSMLQGSTILCTVIPDHPIDRDYGYWFYNAVRLAAKLGIRSM